jgi:NTP pyrophosphatase (non-canonical NTP hydrolase)
MADRPAHERLARHMDEEAHAHRRSAEHARASRNEPAARVEDAYAERDETIAALLRALSEGPRVDAENLKEKLDSASEALAALCDGTRFTMSVPAQPDYDHDLLIGAGLRAGYKALRALGSVSPSPQTAPLTDDEQLEMASLASYCATQVEPAKKCCDDCSESWQRRFGILSKIASGVRSPSPEAPQTPEKERFDHSPEWLAACKTLDYHRDLGYRHPVGYVLGDVLRAYGLSLGSGSPRDEAGATLPENDLFFSMLRMVNVDRCYNGFKHRLDSWSVAEWTNAMCGEAGEAANIAKKMIRHRDATGGNQGTDTDLDALRAKLRAELADVVIYADLTAASQGIDLGDAVRDTFNAKSQALGLGSDLFLPLGGSVSSPTSTPKDEAESPVRARQVSPASADSDGNHSFSPRGLCIYCGDRDEIGAGPCLTVAQQAQYRSVVAKGPNEHELQRQMDEAFGAVAPSPSDQKGDA